ncbi:hypothetical protein V1227_21255 [Lentzea sp. DG1S-22]|uniref:hypothetical protein n=1 Tax=unclassified Lentzea TaxID=2643253 RepID=UPI001F2834AD|nr:MULTISPECIES: hypothetical protein [unclassified Lentzea]MCG8922193.1 hypothetical protein [Lentzea sp. CC55]WVH77645.1 hypothetical protein V1227_21255 [Lentzea sp. DG1S-22]
MRRNAVALAFMLFLGQLFVVAAPAEPTATGSVVRHGHEFANLPVTTPKPHNVQAAQVPQAQLPMDVPPVARPALPMRFVVSFARRVHRTPEGIRWTPQRDRSPPSGR